MLSTVGQNLSTYLGLTPEMDCGVFHGAFGPCQVLIIENAQTRQYSILIPAQAGENPPTQSPEEFISGLKVGRKGVIKAEAYEKVWTIVVQNQGFKKTSALLNELLRDIAAYYQNNGFTTVCMECGSPETGAFYLENGRCFWYCDACGQIHESNVQEGAKEKVQVKSNWILGLIGAILGSLIGVALWVVINRLGYVAAISGLVMVFCALKGFGMLGGKVDKKGLVTGLLVCVAMLVFAQGICYGLDIHEVYTEFSILDCILSVPAFISEYPDIAAAVWRDTIIGLLFLALGGWATARNIYKQYNPLPQFRKMV